MRARHRHFNPRDIGATMALDSRFLFGLSNNDTVSSWTNRASSTNPAEQSSSADRPDYQTNSLNGNPAVTAIIESNGAPNFLTWTGIQMRSGMALISATQAQNIYAALWGSSVGIQHLFGGSGRWLDTQFVNSRWTNATWQKDGSTFTATNTNTVDVNSAKIVSVVLADNGGDAVNQTRDRTQVARAPAARYYQYQIYPSELNDSTRKRIHHAAAFSFKISCN